MKQVVLTVTFLALLTVPARCQSGRTVGKFEEVFSWKQMTYDINGIQDFQLNQQLVSSLLSMTTVDKDFFDGRIDKMTDSAKKSVIVSTQAVILSILPSKKSLSTVVMLRGQVGDFFLLVLEDRFSEDDLAGRDKRSADSIYFDDNDDSEKNWNHRPAGHINGNPIDTPSLAPINPDDEIGRFFIQYNNVPMGAERVGNRLFVTVPRRRFGIPSTLNYIDLSRYEGTRSPPLTPYPDMARSRSLISVYRTRADECGRLWTVDTGTIEIPNSPRYLQPPAIVVFDLKTDRQILRYQLKSSDLPANNTPTGLASITVAIKNGDCSDAYAFISDVVSYGIIVFSLKQRDSWRQEHNYFHFNPTAGNMRVAGQSFTWNDGVFSVAVGQEGPDGCRPTYFHPMVSNQEFAVSSCELESREANQTAYRVLGDRGTNSQSTMHGLHTGTNVMFFAEVGRDSVSCWNTERPLSPDTMEILAQDNQRLSYPSDLHVSDDEVWVTANTLPRFIYSRLDTNDYNFYIYRAKVRDLITGTACAGNARPSPGFSSGYGG